MGRHLAVYSPAQNLAIGCSVRGHPFDNLFEAFGKVLCGCDTRMKGNQPPQIKTSYGFGESNLGSQVLCVRIDVCLCLDTFTAMYPIMIHLIIHANDSHLIIREQILGNCLTK